MMPIIPSGTATRILLLATGILFLDGGRHLPPRPPAPIVGWWHGTSTCVRETWNKACNDEVVEYEFVPAAADPSHATLRAFKLVGGAYESMGDLSFVYAADSQAWNGDFANSRVDIRWTFRSLGDSLSGQLVLRPDLRVARHVVAWRGKDPSRHPGSPD